MTLSTSESETTSHVINNNNNNNNINNNNTNCKVSMDTADPLPPSELSLLAKLEAANKLIESDSKSLNSLQSSAHSRKSSDTSQISLNSGSSSVGEEDIWSIWATIVTDWETAQKTRKSPSVKDLVRKGIPHHFRAIVWQLLCSASDTDKKQYAEYIKATSACERVIRRDIARTYPEHDFFKEKDGLGQEALFNVMKAYSLHDREVKFSTLIPKCMLKQINLFCAIYIGRVLPRQWIYRRITANANAGRRSLCRTCSNYATTPNERHV
jgi:ecotropic viral integration site 5 protein